MFFVRKRQERDFYPVTFQDDVLPLNLRGQIRIILTEVVGTDITTAPLMTLIAARIRRHDYDKVGRYVEKGVISKVFDENGYDHYVLTFLESVIRFVRNNSASRPNSGGGFTYYYNPSVNIDRVIAEVNGRFIQNGYGMQIEGNNLIPMSSTLIHNSAVRPAIVLMVDDNYDVALSEFMDAVEHYKDGKWADAVANAAKAFESVLKQIYVVHNFPPLKKMQASAMITDLGTKGFFPSYSVSGLNHLIGTLTDGLPTLRNNAGGHGAGVNPLQLDVHFGRYALNLTATNILFLIECSRVFK